MAGEFYGNGFVRRKANQSSGCRVPHVTGVRYENRMDGSVSRRDYVIGGEYFPNQGNALFLSKGSKNEANATLSHSEHRVAPRGNRPVHSVSECMGRFFHSRGKA